MTELFARLPSVGDPRAVQARLTGAYRRLNTERLMSPALRIELAPVLAARSPLGIGGCSGRECCRYIAELAVVALIVLVIATSNVASLLLMHAIRRRREIAIRVALGASPGRLLRSLLAESLTLAIAGGGVALLIASWSGSRCERCRPAGALDASVIDRRTVAFTMLLALDRRHRRGPSACVDRAATQSLGRVALRFGGIRKAAFSVPNSVARGTDRPVLDDARRCGRVRAKPAKCKPSGSRF